MEKKIVICIGTDRDANVRARLSLMVVEGEQVLSEQYHSCNLSPLDDMDATRAAVEAHLAQDFTVSAIPGAPWPAIPDTEWDKVTGVCSVFHTTDVVAAAQAKRKAADDRVAEEQAQALVLAR